MPTTFDNDNDNAAPARTGKSKRTTLRRWAERAFKPSLDGRSSDLLCLSHLRWDFVFQRPQHLLTRFAAHRRVFFFEEPMPAEGKTAYVTCTRRDGNLYVAVPHLPAGLSKEHAEETLRGLVNSLIESHRISNFTLWYYTPMALGFTRHLDPAAVVYDCMDELSAFKGAPPEMLSMEAELLRRANLVFTGGQSLFEAKKNRHPNAHAFPSSIDREHFDKARKPLPEPADQAAIPHPRLGFCGVIDERMDLELVREFAALRPDHQLVLIGPVVKIDPASLPQGPNIHYLGMKKYDQLPSYISGWDVALMPFAMNESTKYISPTKTPEYLAAGKPVVSTPITDVVRPYGEKGLVHIASGAEAFVRGVDEILNENADRSGWLGRVDEFLSVMSWDRTWDQMNRLMASAIAAQDDIRKRKQVAPSAQQLLERRRIEAIEEARALRPRFKERRAVVA